MGIDGEQSAVEVLFLAGGRSSRLGSPKYLLLIPFDDETIPLIVHIVLLHYLLLMETYTSCDQEVTISVRDDAQITELSSRFASAPIPPTLHINYVLDDHRYVGPAAGLISAHQFDPRSHWLVTGCDYPLVEIAAFRQLRDGHRSTREAITCFFNSEGWAEPLLAIWTSAALSRLRTMADEARPAVIGPIRVIKALEQDVADSTSAKFEYERGLAKLKPGNELWIKGVNTKEEWQEVQEKFLPTHATLS